MSEGTPNPVLPQQVEPRKLAHFGATLSGPVPMATLTRLAEATLKVDKLQAELAFSVDDQRMRLVQGHLDACVELRCQRCLEPVGIQVDAEVNLAIVRDEQEAKNIPASYDPWIVAEENANLYSILEEEMLLNLPIVALHEHDCVDMSQYQQSNDEPSPSAKPDNPFQVLDQLKGSSKK